MTARQESAGQPAADSRVFVAGPAAILALHHILGIPPALRDNGTYRVTRAVWIQESLQVDLVGRGFQRALLRLCPPAGGQQSGAALQVSVDGPQHDLHPAVERLLRTIRIRLAKTPASLLLELIRKDPSTVEQQSQESRSAGDAEQRRDGRNAVPKPYAYEWTGKPDELGPWGLFFDDLVFVYTGFTRVNFVMPTTHVMHGNHECLCVTPKIRTRSAWPYNYPRRSSFPASELVRARLGMGPQYEDKPFRRLSTDMSEVDTVLGGDDKLGRVLQLAVVGQGERLLGIHKTCLPKVMGDDVERSLDLVRDTPGVHCLTHCMGFTHDQNLYAEELEFGAEESKVLADLLLPKGGRSSGRAARGPEEGDTRGARFDLVGFPDGTDTLELAGLVEDCGAQLNMLLLPEVDVPVFRRTPRPDLQIRFPNRYFQKLYKDVFDQLADHVVAPPAPFGLRASETWVRAVADALGIADQAGEAIARVREEIGPRWDALSALAHDMRLGFVIDPRVLPRLIDPATSFGLSMPSMLEEMGFGIDVLCYAPQGDLSYAQRALQSSDVRLIPFRNEDEMHARLREGEFGAVYSDRNFERRLTANGKAWFGFGEFELGFRGALRSLERLVRACSLPFYARHARYLGRGAS